MDLSEILIRVGICVIIGAVILKSVLFLIMWVMGVK